MSASLHSVAGADAVEPPGIYAPHSIVRGSTLGQWSAAWWQWAVSFPTDHHQPWSDTGGELGQLGNVGKVFFLAGEVPGGVTRTLDVPSGTPVFFPLINAESSTAEGNGTTFAELEAANKQLYINTISELHATLDGVSLPMQDLFKHEEISSLYQYTLPQNNVWGVAPGTTNSVADGFWIMTKPLSEGRHVFHFGGTFGSGPGATAYDATYVLNVVPRGHYQREPITPQAQDALAYQVAQPPLPGAGRDWKHDTHGRRSDVLK